MSHAQNGIFVRSHHDLKKELRINKPLSLNYVRVCNGEMLAAVSSNTLIQADVLHTQHITHKPAEIVLPLQSSDYITSVHLSPTAKYAIVSTKSADNHFINVKSATAYSIKKIKGVITAVAWNPETKGNDTGNILLGTSRGCIQEAVISATGVVSLCKEHPFRQGEIEYPISTLSLHLISDEEPKSSRWALFICLPDLLYTIMATIDMTPKSSSFVGSSSLQSGWAVLPQEAQLHIFQPFFLQKELHCLKGPGSLHLANNGPFCSSFALLPQNKDKGTLRKPKYKSRYVWLTSDGYTIGETFLLAECSRELLNKGQHVSHQWVEGVVECPMSVSLTEHHVLLQYPHRLRGVSAYTNMTVYEDVWPAEWGSALGITSDDSSSFHWLYTSSCVLKYRPNDEARYVWKVFMEQEDYSRALAVARDRKEIDSAAYELVLSRQADKYISEKNFGAAAEILAQSTEAFETVVLRFLTAEDQGRTGLKTLLDKKLQQFDNHEEKIKRDTLFMWLLEIQLSELSELRMQNLAEGETEEKKKELTRQLHALLMRKSVQDTLKSLKEAVYRLMITHADFDSQLSVATQLKDYDTVIRIRMSREQYREALLLLIQLGQADLLYSYAPALAENIPEEFFAGLEKIPTVRPYKILPLLCQTASPLMAEYAIPYLEGVIRRAGGIMAGESLHNLLVNLYARFRSSSLLKYLVSGGYDKNSLPYDLEGAIRTCRQYELTECTVHLFCVAGMFSEAVDLALLKMKNVALAKECVRRLQRGEEDELFSQMAALTALQFDSPEQQLAKGLWLRIARYLIEEGGGDAASCIELLKESGDVIKIQDIFPLFPEFTKIEHVKEPLVSCLREHSEKIRHLQNDMKTATQNLLEIREKTEKLKCRVLTVRASDCCTGCLQILCTRPFYAHACRHLFHRDCLEKEMMPFLTKEEKNRLGELIEKERKLLDQLEYLDKQSEKTEGHNEREALASSLSLQITEILGKDCPRCSILAIEYVTKPFFTDEEFQRELDCWAI